MKILKKIIKWLLIVLILLLAACGTAAYMGYKYLSNDPWANCYDDVNSMELYEAVSTKNLMSYDRTDHILTLTVDKRIMYSLYKVEKFNAILDYYNAKITNVGIKLLGDSQQFELYLELYYKDKIPAHIWAKGDIEYEDLKFNFVVKEAKLGEKYDLDLEKIKEYLGVSEFSLAYEINTVPIENCFPYKSFNRDFMELSEITEDKMVIQANVYDMLYQYENDRYKSLSYDDKYKYIYSFKNLQAAINYNFKDTLNIAEHLLP